MINILNIPRIPRVVGRRRGRLANPLVGTPSMITDTTFTHGRTTYTVEYTPTAKGVESYTLRGPRDAHYRLIPNVHRPEFFFAVNQSAGRRHTPFDGRWFTIKEGRLRLY